MSKKILRTNLDVLKMAIEAISTGNNESFESMQYQGFGGAKDMLYFTNPDANSSHIQDNALIAIFQDYENFIQDCEQNPQLKNLGLQLNRDSIIKSLKSSLSTQFYTPEYFIDNLMNQFKNSNQNFKTFLEPSAGSGKYIDQFIKHFPLYDTIVAYEVDVLAALILKAKYLHEPRISIRNQPFQSLNSEERFDLIASNIPFSNNKVFDPKLKEQAFANTLHGYYFAKAQQFLSANGILSFICPSGILHTPDYQNLRNHLSVSMSLLHAVQLPNDFYDTTQVNSAMISLSNNLTHTDSKLIAEFRKEPIAVKLEQDGHVNTIHVHPMFHDSEIGMFLSSYNLSSSAEVSLRPYGRLNYWYNNFTDPKALLVKFNDIHGFERLIIQPQQELNTTLDNWKHDIFYPIENPLPIHFLPKKLSHQLDIFDSNPGNAIDLDRLLDKKDGFSDFKYFFKLNINYSVDLEYGWKDYVQTPFVVCAAKRNADQTYYYQIINLNDADFFNHISCNKWINRERIHFHIDTVFRDYFTKLKGLHFNENHFDISFNSTIQPAKNLATLQIYEDILNDIFISSFNPVDSLKNELDAFRESIGIPSDRTTAKPPRITYEQRIGLELSKYIDQLEWYDKSQPIVVPYSKSPFMVSFARFPDSNEFSKFNIVDFIANETAQGFYYFKLSSTQNEKWESYINLRNFYLSGRYKTDLPLFNDIYDSFRSNYKELNNSFNKRLLRLDPYYTQVAILERGLGKKWVKSDIFLPSFHSENPSLEHLKNNAIASFQFCINRYAKVDIDYIQSLSNLPIDRILNDLSGIVYINPQLSFVTKEQLLKGNLRDTSYAFSAIEIDRIPTQWKDIFDSSQSLVNKSIPTPVPFETIGIKLGEHWLDDDIYTKFANYIFQTDNATIARNERGSFMLSFNGSTPPSLFGDYSVKSNLSNRSYNAAAMLTQFAMRAVYPEFTYTVKIGENSFERRHDALAEVEAQQIIQRLQNNFKEFLFKELHPDEQKKLETKYNYLFNSSIQSFGQNAGEHLSFYDINWTGAAKKGIKEVRQHQKKAIWKALQNKGGIIDHEVGLGKTMVLCILAHEFNRLNIAKKNLILCMKANVNEIAETYHLLYPQDNLYYPSPKDLEAKNLELFIGTIKNNNFDTIILSYEMFNKLPSSPDIEREFLEKEISDLNDSILMAKEYNLSKREINSLNNALINKESHLSHVMSAINSNKFSDYISFEQLNIGHILVDESHNFKNLTFNTYHKRIKGLGNPEGSQRATNLLLAIRSLQKRNGQDLQATFLSGTPISNSLTEMYLLFKYLIPSELENRNLNNFDSFAQSFCSKSLDFELDVVGNIKHSVERFREFDKIPELSQLYASITDYNTADNIGLDRPQTKLISVAIEPDPIITRYLQYLKEFAETGSIKDLGITQSDKKSRMLEATNMGRLVSLHPKLLNANESLNCETKISACVSNVIKEYHDSTHFKGTQIVFCDVGTPKPHAFNVYDELKRQLIEHGIPSSDIAFIHDSTTDAKKEKLFLDMNQGNVRVLVGSSDKAGTGLNVQNRLIAIHNLDVPWTPKSLTQREGRIKRQGNWACKEFRSNVAHNYIYGIKGSIDMFMYQLISNKAKFINSARNFTGTERSLDMGEFDENAGISFAAFSATLSGDSSFLEKARLEGRLKNLELQLESIQVKQTRARSEIYAFEATSARFQEILPVYQACFDLLDKSIVRDKEGVLLNQLNVPNYTPTKDSGVNDLGKAFTLLASSVFKSIPDLKDTPLASFYQFPVVIRGLQIGLLIEQHFIPVNLSDKTMAGNLYLDKYVHNARIGLNIHKHLKDEMTHMHGFLTRMETNLPKLYNDLSIDTSELVQKISDTRLELRNIVQSIHFKAHKEDMDPKPPFKP